MRKSMMAFAGALALGTVVALPAPVRAQKSSRPTVAILDLALSFREILLLSIAAIAASLLPLGRVGYREAGVAAMASILGMNNITAGQSS